MRESGHTPSRLVAPARALRTILAGAVLLASAGIAEAQTSAPAREPAVPARPHVEAAFAVPRLSPAHPVAMPQPLAPDEASLLQRIFAMQARGRAKEAAALDSGLDTSTALGEALLGHVLADRYLGPGTRPDARTLEVWLARWPTLAEAPQIHALLLYRLPHGAKAPPAPSLPSLAPPSRPGDAPDPDEALGPDLHRHVALDRRVITAARGHRPYAAAALIADSRVPPEYAAALRAEAGHVLFLANRDREAYDTAAPATRACEGRTHCETPALGGFVAGLAAWRMDEPEKARPMFEAAWLAGRTTANLRAAAAFWAARTHQALHDPAGARTWLGRAAEEPATFYGLLARRILGKRLLGPADRVGAVETLGEADVDALMASPAGAQAFALLQVGERDTAAAELAIAAAADPGLARSVMLVALRERMGTLAAQAADLAAAIDGQPREAIRFTIPDYAPRGGFTTDPALILGIARAESNFDVRLVSGAGARGLMQIMPETARFVTDGRPGNVFDPATNLALGERYVAWLGTAAPGIDANLLRVLASYNAGPAAFARWSRDIVDHGDPLLFLEAIPVDETRAFVPRVLTYSWLYAARMGRVSASLDALAADTWPRYRPAS